MAFQCCQHASLERCYNVYKLMLHETLRLENSFCLKNFISHKKLCFCDCFSNHQLFSLEIWNAKTTWKGGSFLFCKKKLLISKEKMKNYIHLLATIFSMVYPWFQYIGNLWVIYIIYILYYLYPYIRILNYIL